MKRMHVSVSVKDLDKSITFYSSIFGQRPALVRDDYARWMVQDPILNFSIQSRGRPIWIDHVGMQADNDEELQDVFERMKASERPILEMGEITCCYSRQSKSWVTDPQGLFWEAFITKGDQTVYGDDPRSYDEFQNKILNDEADTKSDKNGACCG